LLVLAASDDEQRVGFPWREQQLGGQAAPTRGGSRRSGMAVGLQLDRPAADDSVSLALGVAIDVLEPFEGVVGSVAAENRLRGVPLALKDPPVYVDDGVLARKGSRMQQRRGETFRFLVEVLPGVASAESDRVPEPPGDEQSVFPLFAPVKWIPGIGPFPERIPYPHVA
jgi:hypothetical protein